MLAALRKLAWILQETDFDSKCLELELTESFLIKHSEIVNSILLELQSLGVQVAIDDFGTGYSSLSYLKKFSFNTIKVDRCFVNGLVEDSKNAATTIAIIQMAHAMNLKVIAEGVETDAWLSLLR